MQMISRPLFRLCLTILLLPVALGGLSCLAQTTTPLTPTVQDSSTDDSGGADTQAMRDKMFLRKSALGGMAEVQLGQLALQKSTSEGVKRFAQRMVDDHTLLNDTMKPFATSFGVKLPTTLSKQDQADFNRLSSLSGEEFDREYLALMMRDHHKDLKEFEQEAASASDPGLREAVKNGHRVIAHHTHMADKMAAANAVAAAATPAAK